MSCLPDDVALRLDWIELSEQLRPDARIAAKWRNEAGQELNANANAHYPGRYHNPFNAASLDSAHPMLNKPPKTAQG